MNPKDDPRNHTIIMYAGWEVTLLVDSNSHLNVYIKATSTSDIRQEFTGHGYRKKGKKVACRFSTELIEKLRHKDRGR